MTGRLSPYLLDAQKAIKARIWNGEIQAAVAESVNMARSSVQSIVGGIIWHDVPWPDGSVGPLSEVRRREIALLRKAATGKKTRHFKSAIAMAYQDITHRDLDAARDLMKIYKKGGMLTLTDTAAEEEWIRNKAKELREVREKTGGH